MKPTQPTSSKTKFEQDLQIYFPDLYKFWSLFAWDNKYEFLMSGIEDMVDSNGYGSIEIIYQKGKVNYINLKKQLTANSAPPKRSSQSFEK